MTVPKGRTLPEMAILSIKTVKRSTGRTAVAASAYRTATKLIDDRTGQTYDYTRKQGVEFTEILIPENAPRDLLDRNTLWDNTESAEKRINSVTAREAAQNSLDMLSSAGKVLLGRDKKKVQGKEPGFDV